MNKPNFTDTELRFLYLAINVIARSGGVAVDAMHTAYSANEKLKKYLGVDKPKKGGKKDGAA